MPGEKRNGFRRLGTGSHFHEKKSVWERDKREGRRGRRTLVAIWILERSSGVNDWMILPMIL